MYIPAYHRETSLSDLHGLIETYPLGTWICNTQTGLDAHHLPFVLDKTQGEFGVLRAHVSRANEVWRHLLKDQESLVVFTGPQSYITPNWYPSKKVSERVVPTWNYTAVHVRGQAIVRDDREWVLTMLAELTEIHELKYARCMSSEPWTLNHAPQEFIERLSKAVVGIEIPIRAIEGRWKLSQDEAHEDKMGAVKGLRDLETQQACILADLVELKISVESNA